ncbi:hypothetical protein E3N88_44538 [Mikania micrantha]|uniref:GTP-eEF1A C-terminal domain-containing protein n=1 Tax=Mikania micrantha TaxID=192012 RepID=A0A5N6LBR4_9ASTR|nr:hypothetical protein E3N88_44538 [Mikania micrantha]
MSGINNAFTGFTANGITQVITNVYYVPKLTLNLVSVGQLQDKALTFTVKGGICRVYHPIISLILTAHMSKNKMFPFIATNNPVQMRHEVCEVCATGKQQREIIPKKRENNGLDAIGSTEDVETIPSGTCLALEQDGILADTGGAKTLRFDGALQGILVSMMVDSGATSNFVSRHLVMALGLPFSSFSGIRIKLGDGYFVYVTERCLDLPIHIGSCTFVIDALVFETGILDLILGMAWLQSLGEVLHDWQNAWMKFTYPGTQVMLQGISTTAALNQWLLFDEMEGDDDRNKSGSVGRDYCMYCQSRFTPDELQFHENNCKYNQEKHSLSQKNAHLNSMLDGLVQSLLIKEKPNSLPPKQIKDLQMSGRNTRVTTVVVVGLEKCGKSSIIRQLGNNKYKILDPCEKEADIKNVINDMSMVDIVILVIDSTRSFKEDYPNNNYLGYPYLAYALGFEHIICCLNKMSFNGTTILEAYPGEDVDMMLEGPIENVIKRGDVISSVETDVAREVVTLIVKVLVTKHDITLKPGFLSYLCCCHLSECEVVVKEVINRVSGTILLSQHEMLVAGQTGHIRLTFGADSMVIENFAEYPSLGRCMLLNATREVVAVGTVIKVLKQNPDPLMDVGTLGAPEAVADPPSHKKNNKKNKNRGKTRKH